MIDPTSSEVVMGGEYVFTGDIWGVGTVYFGKIASPPGPGKEVKITSDTDGDQGGPYTCTLKENGNWNCDGAKNFVQPINQTHKAIYTSQESASVRAVIEMNEVEVNDGKRTVKLPSHFSKVVSNIKPDIVTKVTPDKPIPIAVTEESQDSITVESAGNEDFHVDITVKGIREGYEDKEVVRKR